MTDRIRPVSMIKHGDTMVVEPRFLKLFHKQFEEGTAYPMLPVENRSMASHNHYFAALHEGFLNLSEEYAQEFETVEHLRHWCLCQEGFCTKERFELNTAEDANVLRKFLKDRDRDHSIFVKVVGSAIIVSTPESQSMAAMKRDKFEDSKEKVLARVASMARTTPAELKKNAGRSG